MLHKKDLPKFNIQKSNKKKSSKKIDEEKKDEDELKYGWNSLERTEKLNFVC